MTDTHITRAIEDELARIWRDKAALEAAESALVRLLARVSVAPVAEEAPAKPEAEVAPPLVAEAESERPEPEAARYRHGNAWSPAEIETLSETYAAGGIDAALKALPNRTKQAITWRASKLGIRSGVPRHMGGGVWTPEEDRILTDNYPQLGGKVKKLLPERQPSAIYARATKLGLKRNRKLGVAIDVQHPPAIQPTAKPPRPERTFPETLEAVRNGARIVEVVPLRVPGPERTLGGVVGEIN